MGDVEATEHDRGRGQDDEAKPERELSDHGQVAEPDPGAKAEGDDDGRDELDVANCSQNMDGWL